MIRTTIVLLICIIAAGCATSPSITAVPDKPDMAQQAKELQDLQFGMFICWSFSTFSGHEWTPGVDDISFFNPTGFEPDQWCQTMKDAGMGYVLFLTKHHDGFCLWDTKTTDRKVTQSPLGKVLAKLRKFLEHPTVLLH